jgi:hypothetical protein
MCGPHSRRRLGPRAQRVRGPCVACARSARPALAGPASACMARDGAAHAGAVTAPWCTSRCGRRRRYSGGGGANGGGQAPTTVRLPTGHGGGGDSSLELLIDSEGEKTGSAAAFSDEVGLRWPAAVLRWLGVRERLARRSTDEER